MKTILNNTFCLFNFGLLLRYATIDIDNIKLQVHNGHTVCSNAGRHQQDISYTIQEALLNGIRQCKY